MITLQCDHQKLTCCDSSCIPIFCGDVYVYESNIIIHTQFVGIKHRKTQLQSTVFIEVTTIKLQQQLKGNNIIIYGRIFLHTLSHLVHKN